MKKQIIGLMIFTIITACLIGCNNNQDSSSEPAVKITEAEMPEVKTEPNSSDESATLPEAGIYRYEYTEEMDGNECSFANYIIINGDGTGNWVVQDTVPITYDAAEITTAISDTATDVTPYEYNNQSLFVDEGFGPNEYSYYSKEVPTDINTWLNNLDADK